MQQKFMIAIAAFVALFGCTKPPLEPTTPAEDFGQTVEARQFFADPNCSVWVEAITREQLQKLTEDLYAIGAKKVFFANIEQMAEKKISAEFGCELPQDKQTRGKVFSAFNALWDQVGEDPDQDTGQNRLVMTLD